MAKHRRQRSLLPRLRADRLGLGSAAAGTRTALSLVVAVALLGVGPSAALVRHAHRPVHGPRALAAVASAAGVRVPQHEASSRNKHRIQLRADFAAAAHGPAATAPNTTAVTRLAAMPVTAVTAGGIPPRVLAAYEHAAASIARSDRSCAISWQDLAGIGRVESDHGRDVAAGGGITPDGTFEPPILGPVLDGTHGFGKIVESARGGRVVYAQAIGPMQFLSSTWLSWRADGNGDGKSDADNIDDAALGAGHYLCAGGGRLTDPVALAAAIFSYNHSVDYVRLVLQVIAGYEHADPAALVASAGIPLLPAGTVLPEPTPKPKHPTTAKATPTARPSGSPTATAAGGTAKPTPTSAASTSAKPSPSPSATCTTPTRTPTPTTSPSGGLGTIGTGAGSVLGPSATPAPTASAGC